MNPYRGDISGNLQWFNNYSALWEDIYYHFKIVGGIPQLYARDFMEKVILCVQKYEYVQWCNKCQAILKYNKINLIKSIITRYGENDEIENLFLSAPTLNS